MDKRLTAIVGTAILAVAAALIADPIPQYQEYYDFADQRSVLGIPNFWNVLSNAPFVIVGAAGMILFALGKAPGGLPDQKPIYFTFFLGVFLTGFGSAYFHWNPTDRTLVWDRLPMTISFMAFFSAILGEHLSTRASLKLVWPLILLGMGSVLYWSITEDRGAGDLRPYALVQFLPMILVPLTLLLYKSTLTGVTYIWAVMGTYAAAKVAELLDAPLHGVQPSLSGHSIKHLLAAFGAGIFLLALRKRREA